MPFESEEEYNEAMSEQAAQQYEAEYEQDMAYQEHLETLIKDGNVFLYAMTVAVDVLNSRDFIKSDLGALEYLKQQKKKFEAPVEQTESTGQLPF